MIELHLAEEDFTVQTLIKEMSVSRTQMHRKLKALLNQSANELIHSIRMQKASEMLKNKSATIAEIAYLIGLSSPQYFSRTFKQYFGHSPSEHIKSHS
ncbi:MAG: helix-turn-helix transcriptional regulator [Bacteroidales bacterium]